MNTVKRLQLDAEQIAFLTKLAEQSQNELHELIETRGYYYDIFLDVQFLREKYRKQVKQFLDLKKDQGYQFDDKVGVVLIMDLDLELVMDNKPFQLPQPVSNLLKLFDLLSHLEETVMFQFIEKLKTLGPDPDLQKLQNIFNEVIPPDLEEKMDITIDLYLKQLEPKFMEKYQDDYVLVYHRATKNIFLVPRVSHWSTFISTCIKLSILPS